MESDLFFPITAHQMCSFSAPVRTEVITWHVQDSWILWSCDLRPLCTEGQNHSRAHLSASTQRGSWLGCKKWTQENISILE